MENLIKPIYKDGVFENPFSTWHMAKQSEIFRWKVFGKNNTNLPSDKKVSIFAVKCSIKL